MRFYRSKNEKGEQQAAIPSYATPGSAGMDLTATWMEKDPKGRFTEYGTNTHIEIPPGKMGLLFSRSSVTNTGLTLKNCVGVIDSDYRGEIKLRFQESTGYLLDLMQGIIGVLSVIARAVVNREKISAKEVMAKSAEMAAADKRSDVYKPGDKVGQLVIFDYHQATYLKEVDSLEELSKTQRGTGGYGSTDKRYYKHINGIKDPE